ncbi:MAG: IS6 family transposase [Alphaproteobacteria bacterium GM202ARS2]|nr:IS6 family transposase [Alphaproteobacteria bacterium GM202ARS2]
MARSSPDPFKGHRFPREIISYAVWLYYRFSLSLRNVEDILAHRGITVSCETIINWEDKFGPLFADKIRRNRPNPGDKWFLDEVVIKIKGETFYLWRAVDQHGDVLEIMVQRRRNKKAAKRFLKKLFKQYGQPRGMITDKLRSYGAAKKEVMPDVDHRQHKGLNNRAKMSHKPTRRRERVMQRFKSPHHAQRFCAAHNQINTIVPPRRHLLSANSYRHARNDAFDLWNDFAKELCVA